MIEWVAISAAIAPHVKKYVLEKAGKLAEGQASAIYNRLKPDQKLLKATEIFVLRFTKELDSAIDLATITEGVYRDALKLLLADAEVLEALEKPLDGQSEFNWDFVSRRWLSLRTAKGEPLIALPEDFDWPRVAKRYREGLEKQTLTDPELRRVFEALKLKSIEENTLRAVGPSRSFDLDRYAQSIRAAYGYLKLGSLDPESARYEDRIPLENVYVPQSAKEALPPRDITRDYRRALKARRFDLPAEVAEQKNLDIYAQIAARPILDIVDDPSNERLIVLGDPGLGKSTLLKYLALRWADRPKNSLAVLVELRRIITERNTIDFLKYLEQGPKDTGSLPSLDLDRYLKNESSQVLFDGLDEVVEDRRSDVVAGIVSFSRDYPKARIIVTTRIHGYYPGSLHPEKFQDANFRQFTLQDFDENEIELFIERWHETAFRNSQERSRYEDRLKKALQESPAIRELASNPLLLTMLALLNRVRDLPRDRCKVYEQCAELLLRNWDLARDIQGRHGLLDKLGPDQKMRILELVAAVMQQSRSSLAGNLISEDSLKQIIATQLAELGVGQPKLVAEDLIDLLRKRNFMLAFLGDHQYAFVHRTFLEYFCAREIQYRLEKTSELSVDALIRLFQDCWRTDAWREVLCLLCGLISPERASQCIAALLAFENEKNGKHAILLAAKCLFEIRELGRVQDTRTDVRRALLDLMDTDFSSELSEVSDDIGAFTAEMYEFMQGRADAMNYIVRGWAGDPDTREFLRKCSIGGKNDSRSIMLDALAVGWADDPGTLELLLERATQDKEMVVRVTAIRRLLEGWRNEPSAQIILRDLLAKSEDDQDRQMVTAMYPDLVKNYSGSRVVIPEAQK